MNNNDIFSGVEDTLYIPLVARIHVSKEFPQYFQDEKALSLEKYISSDIIEKNTSQFFNIVSVGRQRTLDIKIIEFIKQHDKCNIVFVGAGLETACDRIKAKNAVFYQIDFEKVIEIRKKVLGQCDNEVLIASDMFNLEWIRKIDSSLPTLLVASGVYQYFNHDKIVKLFKNINNNIPKMELVFDATNARGLAIANRFVKKTGNKDAQMNFYINNAEKFAKELNAKLISVNGFFENALKECKGLKIKTKIMMYFSDKFKSTMVVHLSYIE